MDLREAGPLKRLLAQVGPEARLVIQGPEGHWLDPLGGEPVRSPQGLALELEGTVVARVLGAERLEPLLGEALTAWAEVCRLRWQSDSPEADSQFTAGLAAWRLDPQSLAGTWSPEVFRMLGVGPETPASYQVYRDHTHVEDLKTVEGGLQELFLGRPASLEHRIVRADGEVRWVSVVARPSGETPQGSPRWFVGTLQDVTERRRQERLYYSLAHNLPHGALLLFDRDLRILLAEGAEMERILGPGGSLQQLPLRELLPAAQAEDLEEACRQALVGEETVLTLELPSALYQAQVVPVSTHHEDPPFAGMVLLWNVTETSRQARILQQTQEAAHVGGWEYDCQADQLYWTPETYQLHEVPSSFHPSLDELWSFFPGEALRLAFEECQRLGQAFDLELPFRSARGREMWVRCVGKPIRQGGAVVRIFGSLQDVTRHRWLLSTLQRVHQRNQALLKALPDLLLLIDDQARFLDYKPSADFPRHLAPEVFLGEHISRLLPELAPSILASLEACRRSGQPQSFECALEEAPDRHFEARILGVSMEPATYLILLRDITDRHKTMLELEHSREAALAASRVKSLFLANMSHEIRTPLNGVLGMTELALNQAVSPEQRECLELARLSGESLLSIIDDILDISRIEAGRLVVECVPFELRSLVRDVLRPLEQRAQEKGLKLLHRVAHKVPSRLLGDPARLRQVILNLVGNALKFTSRGEVELRARTSGLELEIQVLDTGPGIPPERQERIFEPFTQGDESTTREFGGTGLGLAICRQLVEKMGGRLWLRSVPGEGSCFYFTLPLRTAPPPSPPEAARSPETGRALRVLLAEDNPINAKVVVRMLESAGHQVRHVENGDRALEALGQDQFDLVLMDLQMPRRDGFEATRQLRARGLRLPVVALTANAMAGDRERCLEAGMDGYLSKPVDRQRLLETVAQAAAAPLKG